MLSLRLNKYWIENIDYVLDPEVFNTQNLQINIVPELNRDILPVDENHAVVKLSINVKKTDKVPFGIKTTICGLFECPKWKDTEDGMSFMKITAVQVLFPYLRQSVSTITGMSNVPQYVLPIVNVAELFK